MSDDDKKKKPQPAAHETPKETVSAPKPEKKKSYYVETSQGLGSGDAHFGGALSPTNTGAGPSTYQYRSNDDATVRTSTIEMGQKKVTGKDGSVTLGFGAQYKHVGVKDQDDNVNFVRTTVTPVQGPNGEPAPGIYTTKAHNGVYTGGPRELGSVDFYGLTGSVEKKLNPTDKRFPVVAGAKIAAGVVVSDATGSPNRIQNSLAYPNVTPGSTDMLPGFVPYAQAQTSLGVQAGAKVAVDEAAVRPGVQFAANVLAGKGVTLGELQLSAYKNIALDSKGEGAKLHLGAGVTSTMLSLRDSDATKSVNVDANALNLTGELGLSIPMVGKKPAPKKTPGF